MALFSFYNVRKPRQFDHKPIYWDPHKEAMEDRIRNCLLYTSDAADD